MYIYYTSNSYHQTASSLIVAVKVLPHNFFVEFIRSIVGQKRKIEFRFKPNNIVYCFDCVRYDVMLEPQEQLNSWAD